MLQRTRYLRPLGILLLALLSFLAAQGTGIRLFFHLFYLLLALLALSYLWAWSNLHGLRVERETFTHRSQVGDEARERITIRNLWGFPKLWVELRDHSDMPNHGTGFVTYLPAHERRRWSARTLCTMRGKFRLGPATLISVSCPAPARCWSTRAQRRSQGSRYRAPSCPAGRTSGAARSTSRQTSRPSANTSRAIASTASTGAAPRARTSSWSRSSSSTRPPRSISCSICRSACSRSWPRRAAGATPAH